MYISNVNSASISLKSIEMQHIATENNYTIQSFDDLAMIYINKGAANFDNGKEIYEIKKRDFIILNPNHEITIEPVRKLEWIRIDVDGILFTSSLEINSADQLFIINDTYRTIKYYLDLALLESENRFRGSDIILKRLLECIMVHILRNNHLSIKDSSIQIKNNEIELIQQFIRGNYKEKITLDQLADLVEINKYYLIRLFKQKTGLSPIDYLIHVRLSEAEKLLSQTNTNISDISDIVGFHSPSHFSKTFRENNHMTPSAYRKLYKNRTGVVTGE